MSSIRLSRIRTFLFSAALTLSCAGALAAEPCAWMSAAEVERELPQYGPWEVETGGSVGACQFRSDTRDMSYALNLNQQFKSSPAEAARLVKSLKAEMKKDYAVEPLARLGAEGFFYRTRDEEDGNLWWVAHQDKVVVMGMLVLRQAPSVQEKTAIETLVKKALGAGNRPQMAEKAANCPYFEPGLLKKLLSGKGFKSQQFGENSCMANNEAGATLILTLIETDRPELIAETQRKDGCTHAPLETLGQFGELSYACSGGNPSASIFFVVGHKVFDVSLVPGKEPTAAQRADLVELGRYIARTTK